jgi:hypothetical protein
MTYKLLALVMAVRESSLAYTWSSDFMLAAGAPGGVRLPWEKAASGRLKAETSSAKVRRLCCIFMG